MAATSSDAPDLTPTPPTPTPVTMVDNLYDTATNRVTSQTNQAGDVVTFGWNDVTQAMTATSTAAAETTTYTHDSYGHLTGLQDSLGKSVAKTWSQGALAQVPSASPTQVTDRAGTAATAVFYDGAGRVTQSAKPDPTTKFVPPGYNDATPTVCQRLPNGSFPTPNATTSFTRPGGAAATINCAGQYFARDVYTYLNSSDSRVDTFTNAAGVVTKYTYTGGSLVPATVTVGFGSTDPKAPAQTTTLTSTDNLVTSSTDGTGVKTCTAYTALKQVWFTTSGVSGACPANPVAGSATSPGSTVYTYDLATGQVKTVTKPAPQGVTTYAYYGTGQLKSVADPITGHAPVSYTYLPTGETRTASDELGNSTTTTVAYNVTGTCQGL